MKSKNKLTKLITLAALCFSALLNSSCMSVRKDPTPAVIVDTVYGDYYNHGAWVKDKSLAQVFPTCKANEMVYEMRVKEVGEYAGTGPVEYPIKVVQLR
jgi:hypothetical protein